MDREITEKLTAKDNASACAFANEIVAQSRDSDRWYPHFATFAVLLDHPKSYVRNRALNILAANAQWDSENRFDAILPDYLSHITDEKPITARLCIQALAQIGQANPGIVLKFSATFATLICPGIRTVCVRCWSGISGKLLPS